jgi:hypothetical protein
MCMIDMISYVYKASSPAFSIDTSNNYILAAGSKVCILFH